jgi:hypothetical protein
MSNADAIIRYIQAKGSDATDLRDAAHEAHHALVAGARRWDRNSIHNALMRYTKGAPGALVFEEVKARAVEQLVCKDLGVECWPVEKAAHIAWMETTKSLRLLVPTNFFDEAIKKHLDSPTTRAAADAIIKLGTLKLPRKRAA